jgi:hypothetical protein
MEVGAFGVDAMNCDATRCSTFAEIPFGVYMVYTDSYYETLQNVVPSLVSAQLLGSLKCFHDHKNGLCV